MTPEQKQICLALYEARMLPGSWDKRMRLSLYTMALNNEELSKKQIEWMFRLLYKYRAQLPYLYRKHANNPLCTHLKRDK